MRGTERVNINILLLVRYGYNLYISGRTAECNTAIK